MVLKLLPPKRIVTRTILTPLQSMVVTSMVLAILRLMPQQSLRMVATRATLKWMPPQRMVEARTILTSMLPQRKAVVSMMILKSMPVPPRKISSMMMIPKSTPAHWQRMVSTRMRTIEKSTLLRKKKRYGHHV